MPDLRTELKRVLSGLLIPPLRAVTRLTDPLLRLRAFLLLGARLRERPDPSIVLLGAAEVLGTGRVRLGRNLWLGREICFETQSLGEIVIGDDVVISRGTHLVAWERVAIGSGTMIGEYCSIRDANHRLNGGRRLRESGHDASPIKIGCDVWIGRGCAVLAGVTIGDGAIIGANSVVTHDIPSGVVAFGAPARIHRRREA